MRSLSAIESFLFAFRHHLTLVAGVTVVVFLVAVPRPTLESRANGGPPLCGPCPDTCIDDPCPEVAPLPADVPISSPDQAQRTETPDGSVSPASSPRSTMRRVECEITGGTDFCTYPGTGCPPGEETYGSCCYIVTTPILIDVNNDGFSLTDAVSGVRFDFAGVNRLHQTSWTASMSDDGWLALDRNANGVIDSGPELFGDKTAQPRPASGSPNGFLALAEFDKVANGGNRDRIIDSRDSVFRRLLLWQDKNHDGISQSYELRDLSWHGIRAIDLDFKDSRRRDEYGNLFRYRAKVYGTATGSVGRWAYDVFLKIARR